MNSIYNRLEEREAKKDGFELVRNSGRGREKGDAKNDNFLVDYKFNKKSFQLTNTAWKKLLKDAWKSCQRNPLIIVKFEDGAKVAIVEWETLKEYLND